LLRSETFRVVKMASKKKGLSLEEKRKKMMEIFFETKDVYLLKGECKTYLSCSEIKKTVENSRLFFQQHVLLIFL
jgi:hypothetical protein